MLRKTVVSTYLLIFTLAAPAFAETWNVSAYCSCRVCCLKSDGITASNKPATWGTVAVNWLPFGTRVRIEGFSTVFTVQDRGAKSIFGTKKNPKKAIDIWFPSHKEALRFGRQSLEVKIIY